MDADGENTSITQPSLIPVNTNPQSLTRLPKLTIPTFSGNPLTWQTFRDSFSAAVHSNNTLSGIHKFNYLRAHLSDELEAVALLQERFGQTEKMVNAHMHALLALPNPSNNLASLLSFHDGLENHIKGLSALHQSKESYSALLVPIILQEKSCQRSSYI